MNRQYRIGIDFGTCFSFAVTCMSDNDLVVMRDKVNLEQSGVPSIFLQNSEDGSYVCGHKASRLALKSEYYPDYIIEHVKQHLLSESSSKEKYVTLPVNNFELRRDTVSSRFVVAELIKELVSIVSDELTRLDHFAAPVKEAVIAVPVSFSEQERSVILEGAQDAGLDVIDMIVEPEAVAVDYILQHREITKEPVLVYDLGGGTADVACVRRHSDKTYEVMGAAGARIGGRDWDKLLEEMVIEEYEKQHGKLEQYEEDKIVFSRDTIVKFKHKLCSLDDSEEETIAVPIIDERFKNVSRDPTSALSRNVTIKKADFVEKTKPLLIDTLKLVRSVARRCGLKTSPNGIYLVLSGGGSRMPAVESGILKILEQLDIKVINKHSVHYKHEEAIARGAARIAYSAIVRKQTNCVYGVSLKGSKPNWIIDKGAALPVAPINHTLQTTNENEAEIIVYERIDSSAFVARTRREGHVGQRNRVTGIKFKFGKKVKVGTNIKISLEIDKNGVLKLMALNPETDMPEYRSCVVSRVDRHIQR